MMLKWVSGFSPEGRLYGALQKIETAVGELGMQWFAADHDAKLACGQYVIEALRKLMPDYDFSRNLYAQFFFFAKDRPATVLEQSAKQFTEIATSARIENPPLFVAMGSISQLFSLFAISGATKGEKTRQAAGAVYTSHSRTMNDMIQYVLYHRGV
jgi:hypothetical protein